MAVGKEIKTQIKSIQNTRKITSAMEMVAASKMRKAQDRMAASRPYAQKIRAVIGHMANAHAEYRHRYLEHREAKRIGYVVVTSDRGLCGGLNTNLLRRMLKDLKGWEQKGVEAEICAIGQKGASFFKTVGGKVVAVKTHLGDVPQINDIVGAIKVMLDKFDKKELDHLYLVSNGFINTMSFDTKIEQLLPLVATDEKSLKHHWDYLYEPDAKDLMNCLLVRFVESQVYQAVVENNACEQAARMMAMKSATDNAGNLIRDLNLVYNKARQAAITQEISEIVGGAAAV